MNRRLKAYIMVLKLMFSYKFARFRTAFMSTSDTEKYMAKIHKKNGAYLRKKIRDLKGLYIKVGQLISILATFLPSDFTNELTDLQDKLPPRKFDDLKKRLLEEWDSSPDEIFEYIEETPVAAASIGQVHKAVLKKDGRKVAVKIKYPGLEQIINTDLKALKGVVKIISWFFPDSELHRVYEELRKILLEEVDFSIELKNIKQFEENFEDHPEITAPKVIEELCTSNILVTEFIEGIKSDDTEGLKAAGLDPEITASLILESFALQIFEYGFYHADPHPGNIIIQNNGNICFLDFGAACYISETMREGMVEFVQAAIQKDTSQLIESMKKMGFIAKTANPRVYDRVVAYFYDKFQQNIGPENIKLGEMKIDLRDGFENINDLKKMDISLKDFSSSFHVPREWVLLERTILLLMGTINTLAPDLDISEVLIPHFKRFSIKYGLDPSSLAVVSMKKLVLNTVALPAEIRNTIKKLEYGEIEVKLKDSEKLAAGLYYGIQETVFGLGTLLLINMSWQAENSGKEDLSFYLNIFAVTGGVLFLRSLYGAWSKLMKR